MGPVRNEIFIRMALSHTSKKKLKSYGVQSEKYCLTSCDMLTRKYISLWGRGQLRGQLRTAVRGSVEEVLHDDWNLCAATLTCCRRNGAQLKMSLKNQQKKKRRISAHFDTATLGATLDLYVDGGVVLFSTLCKRFSSDDEPRAEKKSWKKQNRCALEIVWGQSETRFSFVWRSVTRRKKS